MKKLIFLLLAGLAFQLTTAQNKIDLKEWKLSDQPDINMPAFADKGDINGDKFEISNLIKTTHINVAKNDIQWNAVIIGTDSILLTESSANNLFLIKNYLSVNRWTKGTLNLTLNSLFKVYVNGNLVNTKSSSDLNNTKINLELDKGNHEIAIQGITTDEQIKLAANFEYTDDYKDCEATSSLNSKRLFTIHDVLEGNYVSSAKISPSGKYVLINYSELVNGKKNYLKY